MLKPKNDTSTSSPRYKGMENNSFYSSSLVTLTCYTSVKVIPQLGLCLGAVSLWQQCVGQGSVYSVHADDLLVTLSTVYSSMLPERVVQMADAGTTTSVYVQSMFIVSVMLTSVFLFVQCSCVWLSECWIRGYHDEAATETG